MAKCTAVTEVWSRVTGFYRPTSCYNKSKQEEYRLRKTFNFDKDVIKEMEDEWEKRNETICKP